MIRFNTPPSKASHKDFVPHSLFPTECPGVLRVRRTALGVVFAVLVLIIVVFTPRWWRSSSFVFEETATTTVEHRSIIPDRPRNSFVDEDVIGHASSASSSEFFVSETQRRDELFERRVVPLIRDMLSSSIPQFKQHSSSSFNHGAQQLKELFPYMDLAQFHSFLVLYYWAELLKGMKQRGAEAADPARNTIPSEHHNRMYTLPPTLTVPTIPRLNDLNRALRLEMVITAMDVQNLFPPCVSSSGGGKKSTPLCSCCTTMLNHSRADKRHNDALVDQDPSDGVLQSPSCSTCDPSRCISISASAVDVQLMDILEAHAPWTKSRSHAAASDYLPRRRKRSQWSENQLCFASPFWLESQKVKGPSASPIMFPGGRQWQELRCATDALGRRYDDDHGEPRLDVAFPSLDSPNVTIGDRARQFVFELSWMFSDWASWWSTERPNKKRPSTPTSSASTSSKLTSQAPFSCRSIKSSDRMVGGHRNELTWTKFLSSETVQGLLSKDLTHGVATSTGPYILENVCLDAQGVLSGVAPRFLNKPLGSQEQELLSRSDSEFYLGHWLSSTRSITFSHGTPQLAPSKNDGARRKDAPSLRRSSQRKDEERDEERKLHAVSGSLPSDEFCFIDDCPVVLLPIIRMLDNEYHMLIRSKAGLRYKQLLSRYLAFLNVGDERGTNETETTEPRGRACSARNPLIIFIPLASSWKDLSSTLLSGFRLSYSVVAGRDWMTTFPFNFSLTRPTLEDIRAQLVAERGPSWANWGASLFDRSGVVVSRNSSSPGAFHMCFRHAVVATPCVGPCLKPLRGTEWLNNFTRLTWWYERTRDDREFHEWYRRRSSDCATGTEVEKHSQGNSQGNSAGSGGSSSKQHQHLSPTQRLSTRQTWLNHTHPRILITVRTKNRRIFGFQRALGHSLPFLVSRGVQQVRVVEHIRLAASEFIRLSESSDIIIGLTGAGLLSIFFMPPGGVVVEIHRNHGCLAQRVRTVLGGGGGKRSDVSSIPSQKNGWATTPWCDYTGSADARQVYHLSVRGHVGSASIVPAKSRVSTTQLRRQVLESQHMELGLSHSTDTEATRDKMIDARGVNMSSSSSRSKHLSTPEPPPLSSRILHDVQFDLLMTPRTLQRIIDVALCALRHHGMRRHRTPRWEQHRNKTVGEEENNMGEGNLSKWMIPTAALNRVCPVPNDWGFLWP